MGWRQAQVGESLDACTNHIVTPHESHDICCERRIRQQHQEPWQGVPGEEWQGEKNARSAGLLQHELDKGRIAVDLGTTEFVDLALR